VWIGALALVVQAGAGAGIGIGLSGGGSGGKPGASGPATNSPVSNSPVTQAPQSPATLGSPQYTALLQRLPVDVSPSCTDATAQIAADEKKNVQTQASCTHTLPEAKLTITYRTLRGTNNEITSFRQRVLGLGGDNHHGGDCLTLTPAPGQQIGNQGFAQDVDEGSFHGRIWCSKGNLDPTMWYLQAAPAGGSLPILTEVRTTLAAGLETAQLRLNDLMIAAPLR
jgi:hypothetical protein